jgi:hypothetical protein
MTTLTESQKAQARLMAARDIRPRDFDDAEVTHTGAGDVVYVCPIVPVTLGGPAYVKPAGIYEGQPTHHVRLIAPDAYEAVKALMVQGVWFAVTPQPGDTRVVEVRAADKATLESVTRGAVRP